VLNCVLVYWGTAVGDVVNVYEQRHRRG
jgi:hypothetical protein